MKAERKAERKSGQIVSKYKLKLPEKNIAPASRQESLQISATDPRNVARYQNEIDSVLNGTAGSDQMVLLGKPSTVLAQYMESENPLYMPQKSVKKAVFPKWENGGKHGLGRVVLDELLYQLEDPLAITGNTSEHAAAGDHSIVVWTDWKTAAGDSVIVPIRIDATGAVGVYNNVNTVFDAFDPEYAADLMREGNVLYTKNGKSLSELPGQRREVPKMENGNALSGTIVTETGENVKPKYSLKRDAALEKDFASIREQLEAGELTEEQADRLREEAVDRLLTQADKLARIDRAGWKRPEGLAFVPVDFTRDSLAERLCSAGFDPAARAFFSWLGVTYYLPAEAVEETLAALSSLCAAGSALVFDYPDEGFFSAGERRVQNTILMAKAGGEPMRSAFSRPALEALLQKHGFRIGALLTPEDIQRDVIDRAGGALKAFEHVNYCLAIREE